MMKTKLLSAMLVALLVVGTTGITASAVELPSDVEETVPTITFDKEAKQAALEEKGETFKEVMAAVEERMLANGRTEAEIAAMQAKFNEKFEELKAEKAAAIMEKKENREAKIIKKSAAVGTRTQSVTEIA